MDENSVSRSGGSLRLMLKGEEKCIRTPYSSLHPPEVTAVLGEFRTPQPGWGGKKD